MSRLTVDDFSSGDWAAVATWVTHQIVGYLAGMPSARAEMRDLLISVYKVDGEWDYQAAFRLWLADKVSEYGAAWQLIMHVIGDQDGSGELLNSIIDAEERSIVEDMHVSPEGREPV